VKLSEDAIEETLTSGRLFVELLFTAPKRSGVVPDRIAGSNLRTPSAFIRRRTETVIIENQKGTLRRTPF